LKVDELSTVVEDPDPRLLVAVRPESDIRNVLNQTLPDVPWAFLRETPPERRSLVEVILTGSFVREAAGFEAVTTPKLRFVQCLYTGIDRFPFDRFPAGVKFAGNVGAFAPFVSEHAIALALAAGRDLPAAQEMVRTGRLRPPPEQRQLYRSTAVILGYGEIGRAIAERLAGFEATVIGLNRTGRLAPGCSEMYSADRLTEAVARGDVIFEVRPLTRLTRGTIGRKELEVMRPTATFVNVGRAGTVDEEALFHHLESHPGFRAGLDVWWNEDYESGALPSRFAFARLPNVVGTPHSAGYAPDAEARALRLAVHNVGRYFREGTPAHVVDPREYTG
jgi:phosphoglycerate dehydrogenase-like enzyme